MDYPVAVALKDGPEIALVLFLMQSSPGLCTQTRMGGKHCLFSFLELLSDIQSHYFVPGCVLPSPSPALLSNPGPSRQGFSLPTA